ncbi:MAG: 30S ribosomal protein S9 [Bacteroidales bacterium]|nr:30S ribosomal protein S9 [Bacteroidales bacterium]
MDIVNAVGRRKSAVARIFVKEGSGNIIINDREFKEYFPDEILQYKATQPLQALNLANGFDIRVNLDGGGITGQAEALRLAIARALVKINPDYRPALKAQGFLTRDPREVERKKPGRPGARKRFQFSKR